MSQSERSSAVQFGWASESIGPYIDALRDMVRDMAAQTATPILLWPYAPRHCDCDPMSHHRWNCHLTPEWAQTIRDLDTNPWTVITDAIQPIPQIEAWRRTREARAAALDWTIAMGIAVVADTLCTIIGIDPIVTDLGAVEAARQRAADTAHAAHPLTLAGEWDTATEVDYYGGAA
jgi:hypothetical protein